MGTYRMLRITAQKEASMTLSKWERVTEWPMTALALVFVFAYSWEVIARTHIPLCEKTINGIWVLFIIDYVVSISLARNKKAWLKNNLIMLMSIVLPMFRPLRLLRLVAVLNVLNGTDFDGRKVNVEVTDQNEGQRGGDKKRGGKEGGSFRSSRGSDQMSV